MAKKAVKKETKPTKEAKSTKKSDEDAQPIMNLGLVGHVDHGKTTLTEALSGKWTDTHSEELKRGITIRLGYADVVIRKCTKCKEFTIEKVCKKCKQKAEFVRKISLVDAPGHESLMATMLSGARIMDGALLLIAANESCPQPQTREHLMGLQISGIKNVVIIQNKIDLVSKDRAMRNYKQIKEFLAETEYKDAPIIPVSAQRKINIAVVLETIQKIIPTPKRDEKLNPMMYVARSFDINKPGATPDELRGGVLGGVIAQGKIKVGDKIEMRPGWITIEANKTVSKPLYATVTGAMTGGSSVKELKPGGSVAILTDLDPSVVKSDSLAGNVVGTPDKLPPVWHELKLETHLLDRVVGSEEDIKVDSIKKGEVLMLNVNSAATVGFVTELGKNQFQCSLKLPICADIDEKVTISRRVGTRFRLIGYGTIKK
ncbi:MAG: translation initiation factor IF-2 subunit gamma [Nanoarchaeota archaeon]|nr:translation initiation factor IF-2 subunit gamma [Nanoarchaeota archaeon]